MQEDFPQISVVCPTYNSEKFISKTIETVFNQKVLPFELIISDDGSIDNTLSVVENLVKKNHLLSIVILKNLHLGPGAARNAGIRFARGAWIVFLDSDDLWDPMKIERVGQIILKNQNINFVCHNEVHLKLDGSKKILNYGGAYRPEINLSKQLFRFNLFSTSAVVCKKNTFLQNGFFDETLMSAQDYELWLRLSPHLFPYFLSESLGYYVDRQGNISSQNTEKKLVNVLCALSRNKTLVSGFIYFKAMTRVFGSYVKNKLLQGIVKIFG